MLVNTNSFVRHRRSARGSVLVISLLLVLIGTFGMTAWFGLIAARSLEVNAMEDAMRRRVQLNSAKEVARQAGSEWFLSMDGGKPSTSTITLPKGAGQIVFPAWTGTAYSDATALRYHQLGGVPAQSFSTDLSATIDDGGGAVGAVDYSVQLRTYVPALSGELLTIHEPEVAATPVTTDAGLLVNGRTVVWDPGNALGHRTEYFYASGKASKLSMQNLSGGTVLPDNVTFASRSTGGDFIGRIKASNSSESKANRYTARLVAEGYVALDGSVAAGDYNSLGYECNGSGQVRIDLGHASLPNLLITDVSEIDFWGQNNAANYAAAAVLAPRMIVCIQPAGGAWGPLTVTGQHENNRPLVVAIRQEGAATPVSWRQLNTVPPFPRWRVLFELENSPFLVLPKASISEMHLYGGIRTDASIVTTGQTVRILPDTQTPNVNNLASRAGYVEIMRN